jgi:glycosyltransferase involved in cell wall biosynthesis
MYKVAKDWAPVIIFAITFVCTNLIGTLLFLFGPDLYWNLTYRFTGQTLPDIFYDHLWRILLMIFGSLAMFIIGYYIGKKIISSKKNLSLDIMSEVKMELLGHVTVYIFWCLSVFILATLLSFLDFHQISMWLNFHNFMDYRRLVMENLRMRHFIVIYSLMPMFLCFSFIYLSKKRKFIHIASQVATILLINLMIFQKRPFIDTLFMLLFTWVSYNFFGENYKEKIRRYTLYILSICILIIYFIYVGGIYLNTIDKPIRPYALATEKFDLSGLKRSELSGTKFADEQDIFRTFKLQTKNISSRFISINAMAVMGMLNRTAFSSICYPIVFPDYLDYYHLDLGQDMFGCGAMPDDELKVYAILNPQQPNGSVATPFFIVLYSQGGLTVAFTGALFIGAVLGAAWGFFLRSKHITAWSAVVMALILWFSMHIAMANARNSLLSSYGVIYPLMVLALGYCLYRVIVRSRKAYGAHPRVCMLVTSGVVNDSRVLREAAIASDNGYYVRLIGRYDPELGHAPGSWPFEVELLDIQRAEGKGIFAKIVERTRMGLALTRRAVRFNPDIVHCNDFDTLPFGSLAAFVSSSALVYDSHELWAETGLVARYPAGKKLVKFLERILARRCDAVISVSNAAGRWLKDLYKLDNLTVVTNCPYAAGSERLPKNPGFELLTHGKLWYDRGCEELIACSAELAKQGINVRIRGYGLKLDYYRELARQAGDQVIFSGKVPSDQVVSAASASHVGVVLTRPVSVSFALTVSNKLFECVMAGLPLILSDVPEHRMLNERYGFGLILDEMTPEALAGAAILLKNDRALYARLCANAEKAAKELCWEKEGLKLLEIYRAILGNDRHAQDQPQEFAAL